MRKIIRKFRDSEKSLLRWRIVVCTEMLVGGEWFNSENSVRDLNKLARAGKIIETTKAGVKRAKVVKAAGKVGRR